MKAAELDQEKAPTLDALGLAMADLQHAKEARNEAANRVAAAKRAMESHLVDEAKANEEVLRREAAAMKIISKMEKR